MEKALAVANEIIILAKAAGDPPTQMKLQKLMFYAHGWHLALADTPLIDQQFEAWQYGPVVSSVYHTFKHYRMAPITALGTDIQMIGGSIQLVSPQLINGAGYAAALLRKTWEVFGHYSGGQLSAMTHAEGTPWANARRTYGNMDNVPMSDESIKQYFRGLMSQDGK